MEMTRKNLHDDDDNESDRISSPPMNTIHLIMEFLPMQYAIRTSILSRKWRYIWTGSSSMILDKIFFNHLKQHKESSSSSIDFVGIVNRMIHRHIGYIEKFVFDISVIRSNQHCEIDAWLSMLSRKGVKVLSLDNNINTQDPYRLPSCVFSNPQLTNLSIDFNCIIKITKDTFTAFNSLQTLSLTYLSLDSCVLTTPRLTSLSLVKCWGGSNQHFNFKISAPNLVSLTLLENRDLNLTHYLTCTNIISAVIHTRGVIKDMEDNERVNFLQLLRCWPKIVQLDLNGQALMSVMHLDKHFVGESFKLNKLTHIKLGWIYPEQMDLVYCILRNSPFLEMFEMELYSPIWLMIKEKCFGEADIWMEQLHTVKLTSFGGSRYEVELVKFFLHCSPSLNRLLIDGYVYRNREDSDNKKLEILMELLNFPRASSNAKVIMS